MSPKPERPEPGGSKLSDNAANSSVGNIRRSKVSGPALGMRLGTELVVTTMVGTGLGYLIDLWLQSSPWFSVVFLLFGAAAGVRNVYRLVNTDPAST
ncbi:MAG: AtpZ/AtpI family protein [Magnetococcales bacterium]|nr:AtpZ/AtpI family protein [Magnetococcales bacterium]